jgi:hypothetical protein
LIKEDRVSSLFWLFLSLLMLKASWLLPFGTFSQPKHGFLPLIIAMGMGLLSLIFFARSWLGKKWRKTGEFKSFPDQGGWKRIGLALGSLCAYYMIFESAGFLIATFLLLLILIKFVIPQKWLYSFGLAAIISLCSYLLFQVALKSNLPMGILEGFRF